MLSLFAAGVVFSWMYQLYFVSKQNEILHGSASDPIFEQLFSEGVTLRVAFEGGASKIVKTVSDLPSSRLKIIGMTIKSNDTVLKGLPPLPDIESFVVDNVRSNDKELARALDQLSPSLNNLQLSHISGVNDGQALLEKIATRFGKLLSVNLHSLPLEGADLGALARQSGLVKIDLTKTGVSDDQIGALNSLPLTNVTFSLTKVTIKGLMTLQPTLKGISMASQGLHDDDITVLAASFPDLVTLDLTNNALTDSSVEALSHLTQLKTLVLNGNKLTSSAIEYLQGALPDCKIRI